MYPYIDKVILLLGSISLLCCGTKEEKNVNTFSRKKCDYVSITGGGGDFIFVFDKNIELGDGTALLLNNEGNIIENFKNEYKVAKKVVSGVFHKNKSLLLLLKQKSLLFYDIVTKKGHTIFVDECSGDFFLPNQLFFLSDSIALFVTAKDYGGSNYSGKQIIAINLRNGEKTSLAEDVSTMFNNGENIYFTKSFKYVYQINIDMSIREVANTKKEVIGLKGNSAYCIYLTWDSLSSQLNSLWDEKLGDYSDRIYRYNQINKVRYKRDYYFELFDNNVDNVVFRDMFPKGDFDIRSINIFNSYVLFELFNRQLPNVKKTMILTLVDKQYFYFPEDRWIMDCTEDYIVFSGEKKIGVYNVKERSFDEMIVGKDISEMYMNKGTDGCYYYVSLEDGLSCSVNFLNINNLTFNKLCSLP